MKIFENIICAQPFGCLPNHICGKGMIRKIRQTSKNANIVAVDYDPGSSKVNQENRIKLMLSLAKEAKSYCIKSSAIPDVTRSSSLLTSDELKFTKSPELRHDMGLTP